MGMSYPAMDAEIAGRAVRMRLRVIVSPVMRRPGSTPRAAAMDSRESSLGARAPRSMPLIVASERYAVRARSVWVIRRAWRMVAIRRPTSRLLSAGILTPVRDVHSEPYPRDYVPDA